MAHGATQAAAVHAKVVAWFGLRCGAAVRKVRGGKAHVIHSRNGGKFEGPHAQMPRTFRLSLFRIDVRVPEVTQEVAHGKKFNTTHNVQHAPKLPKGMCPSACHTIGGTS